MFRRSILQSNAQLLALGILALAIAQFAAAAQSAAPINTPTRPKLGSLIQIVSPSTPLKLAEKAQISLLLHDKGLTNVGTIQSRYLDPEHKFADAYRIDGGYQKLPVLYRPDSTAYIEFVPLRLGEVELTVFGTFPDRAFDKSRTFLHIVPSGRKPAALIVAQGGNRDTDTLRLNLDDGRDWAQHPEYKVYLYPEAYYYDVRVPIQVDRHYARFAVKQDKVNPVIKFDQATGGMRPLRRGAALVETSFGGLVRTTCIVVRVERDVNDRSDCEPLFSAIRPKIAAPLKTTWAQNPYGMSNVLMWQDFEFLTDRLEVTPPNNPVEFAQPIKVPLKTSSNQVLYYTVAQSRPGFTNWNGKRIAPGPEDSPLRSIPLVPLIFDNDLVVITAHFADHGVSERYFRLHVTPSGKGLKSLELHTFPMENGYLRVSATLRYDQLKDPVQLPDLKRMTYRIDRGTIPDVLRIEPDGRIRRVRAGDAVIVATFCGVTGGVVVKVRSPAQ
ncbi:MAG: hypothetical protein V4587_07990 [Acidobacteriota bacterium]